jgi:hypothetical protein
LLGGLAKYIRQHHLALIALFVALGGTAYATATVGPRDIKKNAVRSRHIKNGQVRSQDVADDSLTGRDVDESSLSGIGAGLVMGRIQDAAAGGTATRYGTPAGIAASSGDESAVEMAIPPYYFHVQATNFRVLLEDDVGVPEGSTQVFTLRSAESDTTLTCDIGSGHNHGCQTPPGTVADLTAAFPISIKIQNFGSPIQTADALVSFRVLRGNDPLP